MAEDGPILVDSGSVATRHSTVVVVCRDEGRATAAGTNPGTTHLLEVTADLQRTGGGGGQGAEPDLRVVGLGTGYQWAVTGAGEAVGGAGCGQAADTGGVVVGELDQVIGIGHSARHSLADGGLGRGGEQDAGHRQGGGQKLRPMLHVPSPLFIAPWQLSNYSYTS